MTRLSTHRIEELLDYATCYGQFTAETPDGTLPDPPTLGTAMDDFRRSAILCYEEILAKRKRRLTTDAAYALGEEAFRVAFKAGWRGLHAAMNAQGFRLGEIVEKTLAAHEQKAWDDYEPTEAVKALIGGKQEGDVVRLLALEGDGTHVTIEIDGLEFIVTEDDLRDALKSESDDG